ncbi:ABC-type oligopeptide transport system ATPase subunit [Streptomyces sp. SAI-208]|nr:ABC-type oligopeptide transport system ATPase subunit [Streptomyces sp. SAI-208]
MSTTQPVAGEPLLEVSGLTKHFPIRHGIVFQRQVGAVHAVDGIDFTVGAGQSLGLVGESGCGKSTTGRLVTRLLEPTAGKVVFDGEDITHTPEHRMKEARRNLQMIFQDPYSSLNPRHTVGTIVETPMRLNGINRRRRGTRSAPRNSWRRSGSAPSTTTATRTSSPAVSASASASPARSPCVRS